MKRRRAAGVQAWGEAVGSCLVSRRSSRKHLNHLFCTVLIQREKASYVKKLFLCWWGCWKIQILKSKLALQEHWCLLLLNLRVRDRGSSVGILSGNPILRQLSNKTFSLFPPPAKSSVSDSVKALQETIWLGHFFRSVSSKYCCSPIVSRGDSIFHISFTWSRSRSFIFPTCVISLQSAAPEGEHFLCESRPHKDPHTWSYSESPVLSGGALLSGNSFCG